MAAPLSKALAFSPLLNPPSLFSPDVSRALLALSLPSSPLVGSSSLRSSQVAGFRTAHPHFRRPIVSRPRRKLSCWEGNYKFPDPIPDFADAETEKFRNYLVERLAKKEKFGDSLDEVVGICTEILSTFLHSEYGGPGTLLVEPFAEMCDTIEERGLPGGPQAARTAVKWAQEHIDKDWKEWTEKQ